MSDSATFFLPLSQLMMQEIGLASAVTGIGLIAVFALAIARRSVRVRQVGALVVAPLIWVRRRWIHARITKAEARLTAEAPPPGAPNGENTPDLDARRNALLLLERIAQNAVRFDAGRAHLRVMEIVCAYIRENAPASEAVNFPLPEWTPLPDGATDAEKAQHVAWREVRFANRINSNARDWAASLKPPRADIALAIRIIGRRSAAQRAVEAAWEVEADQTEPWVFDTPCPVLTRPTEAGPLSSRTVDAYTSNLRKWRGRLAAYRGYRPDLRGTNLQAADLSQLVLSGARLDGARLDGATLCETRLEGAVLRDAHLRGAVLYKARLDGADLRRAFLEGAVLRQATLQGAILRKASAEWANFKEARMDGADLFEARLEVASFYKARMAGVILYKARMDGVVLRQAAMERADLRRAHLPWATLREARLEGANLGWAQLEYADLGSARMADAGLYKANLRRADVRLAQMTGVSLCRAVVTGVTSAPSATFHGVLFKDVDLTGLPLSQEQIDQSYGDASVILPEGIMPPPHWPDWDMPVFDNDSILTQWRFWRDCPAGYKPPRHPDCSPGFEAPLVVSFAK